MTLIKRNVHNEASFLINDYNVWINTITATALCHQTPSDVPGFRSFSLLFAGRCPRSPPPPLQNRPGPISCPPPGVAEADLRPDRRLVALRCARGNWITAPVARFVNTTKANDTANYASRRRTWRGGRGMRARGAQTRCTHTCFCFYLFWRDLSPVYSVRFRAVCIQLQQHWKNIYRKYIKTYKRI